MNSDKITGQRECIHKESVSSSPHSLGSLPTCPVCEKRFAESDDGVVMPFCSRRCQMIDAARWLDERYGMPVEKQAEDDLPDVE